MEVENGPLEDYFPLQTVGELHFHVMCSECINGQGCLRLSWPGVISDFWDAPRLSNAATQKSKEQPLQQAFFSHPHAAGTAHMSRSTKHPEHRSTERHWHSN